MTAPIAIKLLTAEKEHLFALTRLLVSAIDPAFLHDKDNPVTVSVRGSFGSGKKIIPDAAREELLKDKPSFQGVKEFDEFWSGKKDDRPLEVDFINVAWGGWSFHKSYGFGREIAKNFLKERKAGGITFIHNDDNFGEREAGIDIVLESQADKPVTYDSQYKFKGEKGELQDTFNRLVRQDNWARYIQITVRDERLLNSPSFRAALDALSPQIVPDQVASAKSASAPVAVYGVNIPH